jgi:adenylate cyclase
MRKLLLCLFLSIQAISLFAQEDVLDSLLRAVKVAKDDTAKVTTLLDIAKKYSLTDPDKAIKFANEARDISTSINYPKGVATALKRIGIVYYNKTRYADAISNWKKSADIFDSINDKEGFANIQSNIGAIYFNQGEDSKANEYYFSALKAATVIHDNLRIATTMNNIAAVYQRKDKTQDLAIQYYKDALPLGQKVEDPDKRHPLVGSTYAGLGEVFMRMSDNTYVKDVVTKRDALLDSAIVYTALSIKEYQGTVDAPYALNQLGEIYQRKKDYDNAIEVQTDAYDQAVKFESTNDIAIALVGLAKSYKAKGDKEKSLETYLKAEKTAIETGATYSLEDIYKGQSELFADKHDYIRAYASHVKLLGIKDTIYNIEQDRKLQGIQFTFDLEKKEGEINLLQKDKQLQQQEIRRQKIMRNSFVGGFAIVLLFLTIVFTQRNRIAKEKKRSDELLLNILPEETAEELKATGTAKAKSFESVTVMFTDFKNFTQASELLSPEELVKEINYCYSEFDKIITKYGIEKIKTIGDAYMCAGGLPVTNSTHPIDVVRAGLEFQQFILKNKSERIIQNKPYFDLRLGIHTGPVVAGIVGIKKFAYDIWGDTVNTASRMESSGEIGKVNISGVTYNLIKDHFKCIHRGKVEAKNKGLIDMYFVEPAEAVERVEVMTSDKGVISV